MLFRLSRLKFFNSDSIWLNILILLIKHGVVFLLHCFFVIFPFFYSELQNIINLLSNLVCVLKQFRTSDDICGRVDFVYIGLRGLEIIINRPGCWGEFLLFVNRKLLQGKGCIWLYILYFLLLCDNVWVWVVWRLNILKSHFRLYQEIIWQHLKKKRKNNYI